MCFFEEDLGWIWRYMGVDGGCEMAANWGYMRQDRWRGVAICGCDVIGL